MMLNLPPPYSHIGFDDLTPIEQFRCLLGKEIFEDPLLYFSDIQLNLSSLILISLHAIDEAFKNKLKGSAKKSKHYFYLLGDKSLRYLIEKVTTLTLDKIQFQELMYYLSTTFLIYRFTCAKKFCVRDTTLKQLRINSWGEKYVDDFGLLKKYKDIEDGIYKECCEYINSETSKYQQLSKLLSQKINLEVATLILDINKELKIKLLS